MAAAVNDNAYVGVGSRSIMVSDVGDRPTAPPHRGRETLLSKELEYWGGDNLEPQRLIKEVRKNNVLQSALNWTVKALYSGGLQYGYPELDDSGEEILKPARIEDIEQFIRASSMPMQLVKSIMGFKQTGIVFPELILSKDRSRVAMLHVPDSANCRWGKYSASRGFSSCYVSASWEWLSGRLNNEYAVKVPAIQADGYGCEELWMKEAKGHKFIMPNVHWPTLGSSYYPKPSWSPIIDNGWLAYANQIPKFKESYLRNASHIKYAVHVPESWWKWKYPDWDSLGSEERVELRVKEHKRFDTFLTGVENAGRSIMMTFRDNPDFKAQGYTKWDIQVIDKKVIEGILSDDVLETTQMIHNAVGVHGTLLGSTPGAKMGAGSGSDQKQAYNIFMGLSTAEQDILLRPLEVAAAYNGYPELKFQFRNRLIADLKDVSPSKREVQNAV